MREVFMKTLFERENVQLGLLALALLLALAFISPIAKASIHCETNFGDKSFTIEKDSVAITNEAKGRTISSVYQAKSLKTAEGLSKTLYINGNKHFIKIKDLKKPSDSEDYLAITSKEGHKMTYPLTCSVI